MIYIGLLDVEKIDTDNIEISIFPDKVVQKIGKMKCESEKKLRTGAYLLLSVLYNKLVFGKDGYTSLPSIECTGDGKPYFKESEVAFNISHSESVSAVCISDTGDAIGIDIQSEPKNKRMLERAMERFFAPIKKNYEETAKAEDEKEAEAEIFFYTFDGEMKEIEEKAFADDFRIVNASEEKDMLLKWTAFEALVKMEGCGIGKARRLNEDGVADALCKSACFAKNKVRYAVTLAVGKDA